MNTNEGKTGPNYGMGQPGNRALAELEKLLREHDAGMLGSMLKLGPEDAREMMGICDEGVASMEAASREVAPVQKVIVGSLEDDKAENLVTMDLSGKATFCDRMVIASGLADRQISAMAEHLREKLKEAGLGRVQIEGAGGSDWVLIDAGDIVVHLFKPDARTMYALEKMWGEDLDEAV